MKMWITLLSFLIISSQALAANTCDKAAGEIAKTILDLNAKAYGFSESFIETSSVRQLSQTADGKTTYSVSGSIYKAPYEVLLNLDSSCGVEKVQVKDVSAL